MHVSVVWRQLIPLTKSGIRFGQVEIEFQCSTGLEFVHFQILKYLFIKGHLGLFDPPVRMNNQLDARKIRWIDLDQHLVVIKHALEILWDWLHVFCFCSKIYSK